MIKKNSSSFIIIVFFTIGSLFLLLQQTKSAVADKTTDNRNEVDLRTLDIDDYKLIFEGEYNNLYVMTNVSDRQLFFNSKPLQSVALSPSQNQVAFVSSLDSSTSEALSLSLLNVNNGENREVFYTEFPSWDVKSDVKWFGENYLFFLRHCGTGCQGITLLDIHTGERKNATLSYPSFPDQPASTHFKDWLGKEYQMEGLVKEVNSKTIDSKNYLVFLLEDAAGKKVGEKEIEVSVDLVN